MHRIPSRILSFLPFGSFLHDAEHPITDPHPFHQPDPSSNDASHPIKDPHPFNQLDPSSMMHSIPSQVGPSRANSGRPFRGRTGLSHGSQAAQGSLFFLLLRTAALLPLGTVALGILLPCHSCPSWSSEPHQPKGLVATLRILTHRFPFQPADAGSHSQSLGLRVRHPRKVPLPACPTTRHSDCHLQPG